MKVSARNTLPGKVTGIRKGAVNDEITLALPGGETVAAVIKASSVIPGVSG